MNLYASDWAWSSDPALLKNLTRDGWRPNFLVHCAPDDSNDVVAQLSRSCGAPVHTCRLPGPLRLPAESGGTLLLARVEEMSITQQVDLFDWMTARHSSVQVVSIATTRLERLVARGQFLEGLFYRLNVVYLEARCPRISSAMVNLRS
jgi:hypothetical protein